MISFNITFDGTEGTVYALCDLYSDCLVAEGRLTLYKYVDGDWMRVGMWIDRCLGDSLDLYGEFTAIPGTQYWATFWIKAYGSEYSYDEQTLDKYRTCPYPTNQGQAAS